MPLNERVPASCDKAKAIKKNIYILLLMWLDLLDESSLPHYPSSVELAPRPSPPTALLSLVQELEAAHWRAEMRPQAFFREVTNL